MGRGELAADHRCVGRELQRQREAGDDFGEAAHLTGARAAERLQARVRPRQAGAAADGADDERRQKQVRVRTVRSGVEREDRERRLVYAGDVLAGRHVEGRNHVRDVRVVTDDPRLQRTGGRGVMRSRDSFGRHVERPLEHRPRKEALGADARSPAVRRVERAEILVAAHLPFHGEELQLLGKPARQRALNPRSYPRRGQRRHVLTGSIPGMKQEATWTSPR